MKTKISNNVLIDTINDLRLFSQTNYCKRFLKNKFENICDSDLELHSEISSACFRQAFEYYNTAKNSPITTSPLLYSYSLNNMAKGLTYLLTLDDKILAGFKNHGFTLTSSKIKNNLLNTPLTINSTGAIQSLLLITNSTIIKNVDITFDDLIKRVPSLSDIYEKSTNNYSYALKRIEDYEYKINGELRDNDKIHSIFDKMDISYQYHYYSNETSIWVPLTSQTTINSNNNYIYQDNFILPFIIDDNVCVINQLFITYLIIMGYGMLVRYNAHKWEKFIDSKQSDENILIDISIFSCVNNFFNIVHNLLFDYIYIEEKYNDEKVKELLHEKETMDIIENELVDRISEVIRQ